MAHHVEARYDESDGMFLPPLRTLGFNPQLRLNDHLLVQSYIEAYDISYPEALRRIEEEVNELKQRIETEGEYELNDLGTLKLNSEGHYEFEPCEAGILSPDFYGLSTFEMQPLIALQKQEEEQQLTDTVDQAETPEANKAEAQDAIVISMAWVRNVAAIAAAIIAFFIIGTPVSNSDSQIKVEQSSIISAVSTIDESIGRSKTEKPQPTKVTVEATAQQPIEEQPQPQSERIDRKPAGKFTIVLASQTSLGNAEDFIGRLAGNGFSEAHLMGMKNSKLVRVVYGGYETEEDARLDLKSLRSRDLSSDFREAWILEIKN